MPKKPYRIKKDKSDTASEPAAAYQKTNTAAGEWNPNVPFHGTQEEWWEHVHHIEEGSFSPVAEVHQRIVQWLQSPNR